MVREDKGRNGTDHKGQQKHPSKEKQDWQDEDNIRKRARRAVLTVEQRETVNQERRRHQQLNCDNLPQAVASLMSIVDLSLCT